MGESIAVTGLEHGDRGRLKDIVRKAIVELRGGEGRTSYLPGEEDLKVVLEAPEHH